jgi:hypothetical protein
MEVCQTMVREKESDEATWWHTRRVDSARNSEYAHVCECERTRVSSPVTPMDESPVFCPWISLLHRRVCNKRRRSCKYERYV